MGAGGNSLHGPWHKRLLGPDPFPLMPHGIQGQQDPEAYFTAGDPGEERTRHRGGRGGDGHRVTTRKLEPKSPDSQHRPMLLAAEYAFASPQAFPDTGVHIKRGAQWSSEWSSQLSRASGSDQARRRRWLQGITSARALAANPQVFACISVDVEGAFVPPSTSSHGFQAGRARSPAPNSHVGPRDPRG